MTTTKEILCEAGYYEDRKVDITDLIEFYAINGYIYIDQQIKFMYKYAYLEIKYMHPYWNEEMIFKIKPLEAQKSITMDIVLGYNEFLNDKLLIIGEIKKEHMTVFLSNNGIFYGAFDDCIINWGYDFDKMIENLITGITGELLIME